MAAETPTIAVVGSVNLDLVARVRRFPRPGETVSGADIRRHPGGKGANQALAARRLGAKVFMIGCLGEDPLADEAVATLRAEGVDLSYCRRLPGVNTGLALILVSEGGENQIVVAPGANCAFSVEHLDLPGTDALIAQLEVPVETIREATRRHCGFFCLNAAPARDVPGELLERVDLLVVNEIEKETIASRLKGYGGWLAVTFGPRGAVLSRAGEDVARATPPDVEVVDTTGAGDAFTAALTVGLVQGLAPETALRRACAAGALTATRPGAQSSPTAEEVEKCLGVAGSE